MQPVKAKALSKTPLRHVRIEHRPKPQIASDDGQNWAVSYSDMLMVLMSFFVLFFSFEDEQRQGIISKIAIEMDGKQSGGGKASTGEPKSASAEGGTAQGPGGSPSMHQIETKLGGLPINLVKSTDADQLIVHLTDQLYGPRRFNVNKKVSSELDRVLSVLKPYRETIQIVFIGHADSQVLYGSGPYLANNLDLSSLRASRALSYASSHGFPLGNLAIEATSANMRNSRSLSIKIVPKK